ncbi:MAG: hypothetical protein FJX62_00090 [Alphaproteobacteria bacterium]|nr:hypothetical protein [Alphaproteobacteria bacterium]
MPSHDDKLPIELTLKAFEHHKDHARFEESQRSLFVAAYFTVSGILATGIISAFVKDGKFAAGSETIIGLLVLFHLLFTVLIAFAVSKMSGEFYRHFRHAEKVMDAVASKYSGSEFADILRSARLETAGHSGSHWKNWLARFLGVAATYNYILSLFFAADMAIVFSIYTGSKLLCGIASFVLAFFVGFYVQHRYINFVQRL